MIRALVSCRTGSMSSGVGSTGSIEGACWFTASSAAVAAGVVNSPSIGSSGLGGPQAGYPAARWYGFSMQSRMPSGMPDRLYFTDSDEANELIAHDPMALLIGFALDQQVSVQKAFSGPFVIRERVGSLDPEVLARADLEAVFRERPAVHRFPAAMATRVHDLAVHIRDQYGGDAARVWSDARDAATLRSNLEDLPGFGEMKVKALG